MKKRWLMWLILVFNIFIIDVRAIDERAVIIKPSDEEHLTDGIIGYVYMGINSGPEWWGTTKFMMSTDEGASWFYAYCMNNDLRLNDDLLNKRILEYDNAYNYDILKKILYYGYGKDTFDKSGYEYVRKNSYYIWMPYYENGVLKEYRENWTDDLAFCLTHLALSYAYYKDVLKLSDEESEKRAFYGVFESDANTGTKAISVAKLWYEYLKNKPTVGINLIDGNNEFINKYESAKKEIKSNEKISIEGSNIDEDDGGYVKFVVPDAMECVVLGENESSLASKPGVYKAGSEVILGSNQKFSFTLVDVTENIDIPFYIHENYNIIRIKGGKNEKEEFQDITGMYKDVNNFEELTMNLVDNIGILNVTKEVRNNSKSNSLNNNYYISIFDENNNLLKTLNFNLSGDNSLSKRVYIPLKGSNKFYIKETDYNGNVLKSNEIMDINIDKEEVTLIDGNETYVNVLNIVNIENPKTGNFLPLMMLGGIFVGTCVLLIARKKENKFWDI